MGSEVQPSGGPVFATIAALPWPDNGQTADGATATGVVMTAGGLFLIGTVWMAPFGAALVLGGIYMLGVGLVRKKKSARKSARKGGEAK
jgi:hypothetical protein